MFLRDSGLEPISGAARAGSGRISIVFFMVMALGFMLVDRAEAYVFNQAREVITDITSPVFEFLSPPVNAVREFFSNSTRIVGVYEENERLREENARLLAWKDAALALERKNARYEALLNVQIDPDIEYVTARVVTDSGGPFMRTFIINAGEFDGIGEGQAVIDGHGLIGRVLSVGKRASRVLLLSDLNSRVPVLLEGSNYHAILAGDNKTFPKIEFLAKTEDVKVGDRVISSGHGGMLPPGLQIGVVASMDEETIRVQTYSQHERIEQIRVLKFDFPLDINDTVEEDADLANLEMEEQG